MAGNEAVVDRVVAEADGVRFFEPVGDVRLDRAVVLPLHVMRLPFDRLADLAVFDHDPAALDHVPRQLEHRLRVGVRRVDRDVGVGTGTEVVGVGKPVLIEKVGEGAFDEEADVDVFVGLGVGFGAPPSAAMSCLEGSGSSGLPFR